MTGPRLFRFFRYGVLLAYVLLLTACAGHRAPELYAPHSGVVPAFDGQYSLRQRGRLFIPSLDMTQTFTVAATVSMPERKARVVGISGPGLTFFDVAVDGQEDVVHYIHPGLKRIPGIETHILWSVRLVLVNALALKLPGRGSPDPTLPNRQLAIHTGGNIVYNTSSTGHILSATERAKGKTLWTVAFAGYDDIWPKSIRLENMRDGFTLEISTYSSRKEP